MRIHGSKKRFAAVATTTAAVLLGAGIAVAYWTTSGSGSGSAQVAAGADTIDLRVSSTDGIDELYPGATDSFTIVADNLSGDAPFEVSGVTAEVTATGNAGCETDDFPITNIQLTDTPRVEVDGGASDVPVATADIEMLNTTSNQDACKGLELTLTLAAS